MTILKRKSNSQHGEFIHSFNINLTEVMESLESVIHYFNLMFLGEQNKSTAICQGLQWALELQQETKQTKILPLSSLFSSCKETGIK